MNSLPDPEALYQRLLADMRMSLPMDAKLVGVYSGGVWIAERLARDLPSKPAIGSLDVSFYRDDYKTAGLKSVMRRTHIPFVVDKAHLVLIDDVLFTGRSTRAAINELFDYGRPASISLAVMIDRGGRQLPIEAQWVGERMAVAENLSVRLSRADDGAFSLNVKERALEKNA